MFLLSLAAALVLAADCPSAWRAEYGQRWELTQEAWAGRCAAGVPPETILGEGQRAFIATCVSEAQPAIAAGLTNTVTVNALCAQGRSGKDQIPRPGGSQPQNQQVLPAAGQQQSGTLEAGAVTVASIGGRINGAIGTDVASLYGEQTGSVGTMAVGTGGTGPQSGGQGQSDIKSQLITQKGFKSHSIPEPPYLPLDPLRAPYLITLDRRLVTTGVDKAAAQYARTLYRSTLENLNVATLHNLANANVNIYVVPRNQSITDLPEFSHLRDQRTFDGRNWNTVRGMANDRGVAFGEESLMGSEGGSGYVKGYILVHELGHLIHSTGLPRRAPPLPVGLRGILERQLRRRYGPPPSASEIEPLYKQAMAREGRSSINDYANSNAEEYFGEAAASYFGVGSSGGTAEDLRRTNPGMYDLLRRIYGPPNRFRNP